MKRVSRELLKIAKSLMADDINSIKERMQIIAKQLAKEIRKNKKVYKVEAYNTGFFIEYLNSSMTDYLNVIEGEYNESKDEFKVWLNITHPSGGVVKNYGLYKSSLDKFSISGIMDHLIILDHELPRYDRLYLPTVQFMVQDLNKSGAGKFIYDYKLDRNNFMGKAKIYKNLEKVLEVVLYRDKVSYTHNGKIIGSFNILRYRDKEFLHSMSQSGIL